MQLLFASYLPLEFHLVLVAMLELYFKPHKTILSIAGARLRELTPKAD